MKKEIERKGLSEEIELPSEAEAEAKTEYGLLKLKGPKGETSKKLMHKKVSIKVEGKKITLKSDKASKNEKKIMKTFKAHIKNMIRGVTQGHIYKMKICSGHFPMNVSVSGNELIIKNFFGEKHPRKIKINEGVKTTVSGDDIILEGTDKEAVAMTASAIEKGTRRSGYDKRIFQDGCFIVSKNGKEIK